MGRRRRQEPEISDSLDINDIIAGLESVETLTSSRVLTNRKKVRTPCELINCLFGGGIPYGTVTGSFGGPGGGKSTMAYITAGYFLKQEEHGFVIIVDSELSADKTRLEELGVDTSRVIRIVPSSIMNGFDKLIELFKVIEQKQEITGVNIPLYVVWDTITKGRSEDSEEASRMDARNRARVIKSRMSDIAPWLEKLDIVMNNLSQVIITVDKYGNAKTESGGGVALRHDEHIRFYVEPGKHQYNDMGVEVSTISYLTLDKTKISPRMTKLPLFLDITKGGIIDEYKSLLYFFYEQGYFSPRGSYFNFNNLIEALEPLNPNYLEYFRNNYGRSYRWNAMFSDLENDPILYGLLRIAFIDLIGSVYSLQKEVMQPYYEQIKQDLIGRGVIFEKLDYTPEESISEESTSEESDHQEVESAQEVSNNIEQNTTEDSQ